MRQKENWKMGIHLEAYGLKEPEYTVVLTDQDGNETTLYFGNVTGDSYYLTLNEKKEIYTVSTGVIEDFQYSMEDMAQLDTFPTIGSGNLKRLSSVRAQRKQSTVQRMTMMPRVWQQSREGLESLH